MPAKQTPVEKFRASHTRIEISVSPGLAAILRSEATKRGLRLTEYLRQIIDGRKS